MADNVELDAGTGGATVAADDIGGVHYPRSKLVLGANGVNDGDVCTALPMPVTGTGAAGTANTGVVTVQGIASMTPLLVTASAGTDLNTSALATEAGGNLAAAAASLAILDDAIYVDDADWTNSTSKHVLIGGLYESSQQTVTDGDVGPLEIDANGNLRVTVMASALPSGASTAAKQPALGTAGTASTDVISVQGIASMTPLLVTASAGTNLNTSLLALEAGGNLAGAATSLAILDDWDESDRAKVNPIAGQAGVAAGAGSVSALTQRTTLASDDPAVVSLQLIDDAVIADDAAFTPATTKVLMSGFTADETAPDSVNEGDGGAARMTLDRKIITTPYPHTSGGLLIYRSLDVDNGSLEAITANPGQLYGWQITNTGTVTVFVKFYDASSGTLGTGTPALTIGIPGNATDDTLAMANFGGMGLTFVTGICVGAGTGVGDADNTDPGANVVIGNFFYKST